MTERVLLVDDDPSLLSTLDRALAFSFSVATANSGGRAIEMIRDETFPVVVVDMRMPRTDGIAVIEAARQITPDTVFLMLTGNQDLDSAARAVNEGQVFRYLTKPCEIGDLKAAIELAIKQYRLVTAEKELLHKTFVGSVGVLTEVIESLKSDVADSHTIRTTVEAMAESLGLPASWERELAARLSVVGLAMMPDAKIQQLKQSALRSEEHFEVFCEMAEMSASMIDRIPRLEGVAEILRLQGSGDGRIDRGDRDQQLSAALLRVALYWSLLCGKGHTPDEAITEIQAATQELPSRVTAALMNLKQDQSDDRCVYVGPSQLAEGMVLAEHVVTDAGAVLVSAGRRLTPPIVEKLKRHAAQSSDQVWFSVAAASCLNLDLVAPVASP